MTIEAYERHRILGVAWNLVKKLRWNDDQAINMLCWVEENKDFLRMPVRLRNIFKNKDDITSKHMWTETRTLIENQATTKKVARPGVLETHIQRIGELFGLDSLEREILGLAVSYRNNNELESLMDMVGGSPLGGQPSVARSLGVKQIELQSRLQERSRLVATGLLDVISSGSRRYTNAIQVSDGLLEVLAPPRKSTATLREALLGVPGRTDLEWEDFEHVGMQRDLLLRVLDGAVQSKESGVNVLVYGPPGTGKTEFCKVAAARLGMEIYPVGETDDDGGEPTRRERLQSLRLVEKLLGQQSHALILFDEMEDVFAMSQDFDWRSQSRVFIHRMLENNPCPILWTCNHIGSFDEAILRRMSMVIEIKTPTPKVRERIWSRVIAQQHLKLPAEEISILGKEFEAPPAMAANAARAARLAGGGWDDIRILVQGVNKVLTGRHAPPANKAEHPFDPDLAQANMDLKELAVRLEGAQSRQFSLCLTGPSGTGKSAYARYLADKWGMPVIQKRASDLLSKWLGDSEKAIAEAFEQAKEEGAMLIFDEADTLLPDRRKAQRSWEVSQVNEMLTWMENHPLPFVCTTNLMERLDQASLRRFTFKVEFDYLPMEGVQRAASLFFGADFAIGSLQELNRLAPGDFALVARKAAMLGIKNGQKELVRMLKEEMTAKGGIKPRVMGF